MVQKRDIFLMCLGAFIAPSICERFFFLFSRLGLFFRGNPDRPDSPSPCVLVWSPTQTAERTVFSLCSRLYRQCENNNRNTALEAACLWFMLLSFISRRVGENAVTECTPRVWQFKEKIHPQIVIHCLISSACDVQFDGKVFWSSLSFLSDCYKTLKLSILDHLWDE